MHASLNAAHEAYRHAADLTPPPESPGPEPIDVEWRYATDEYPMRGGDLIAVAGGAVCLFAGAALGAWLQPF